MEAILIALIQLTHQLSIKSMTKNLMGYEALMYEKLCDYVNIYAEGLGEVLKRGNDEGTGKTP